MLLIRRAVGFRKALASDIRRRAMDGFKNRAVISDIPAGNNSETAYEPCRKIAHHIAIEIREEQDIELLRIQNNLHARIVNYHLFVFDIGKFGSNGANRPEKQAIRELHDVGFVNGVNFLAALFFCVCKGKRAMRVEARSVWIFRLSTTPGTTSCSRPE